MRENFKKGAESERNPCFVQSSDTDVADPWHSTD